MAGIKLNKENFPLVKTSEGEKFAEILHVDKKAVEQGKTPELMKYGYCMAAGAAKAENKEFPFTLEQFAKACPGNWKQLFKELQAPSNSHKGGEKESSKKEIAIQH